ncbi:MAG: PglZ domain-containing protein [Bacteroides sp.]|jgi:CheY-like chemotaxis protein|nr:PglZ domain-containing protein [Bacteroides sp.]
MSVRILWADDEIDLLKPHIMFLEEKGYTVFTTNNGSEALDLINEKDFDIVFLDENMPGISGLETLTQIKNRQPGLPVVMITKSEEESIMNDAIGSNISDYLIKPVNPHQLLLSLKKNLENKKLVSEKTTMGYQREFRQISMAMSGRLDFGEWKDIYRQLVYWELELEKSQDNSLKEIFRMQKSEANSVFCNFVQKNYLDWLVSQDDDKIALSHTVFREHCLPFIKSEDKTFLIIIDNLRFDQWKSLQPFFEEFYRVVNEDVYCGILPTATQYARNAFFAGLLPSEIEKRHPNYWVSEGDEGTRNQYENELLTEQLKRLGSDIKFNYHKILNLSAGKKLAENLSNFTNTKLNVLVYNFVDMLSHARTEMEVIKELADDEAAYRSLTMSWFEHSPLWDIIRFLSEKKINIILTTDHGSIRVQNPTRVVGDKNTNTNLRYKTGRNLQYDSSEVFEVRNPSQAFLPKGNISSNYIFAVENSFFAYPNNFNYYVNYYRNTFQHGGVSLEEMMIPLIFMKAR